MMNLGVAMKPDEQVQPKIRPTPDGGCYISWFDNDPSGNPPFGYDVFLQRLDANGVAQFPAGGIRYADLGMSSTQDYGLDVDADGNAVLAFLDDRRSGNIIVTVIKVSPTGEQLFGKHGREVVAVCEFTGNPKVAATSDGSVIAGWIEGSNLKFQKIGPPERNSGARRHHGRGTGRDDLFVSRPARERRRLSHRLVGFGRWLYFTKASYSRIRSTLMAGFSGARTTSSSSTAARFSSATFLRL